MVKKNVAQPRKILGYTVDSKRNFICPSVGSVFRSGPYIKGVPVDNHVNTFFVHHNLSHFFCYLN